MNAGQQLKRQSSLLRSAAYLFNRWILRRDFLTAELREADLRFRVKTEDVVGRHIYKYHCHEEAQTRFLASYLKLSPEDVVIDVGANIGWYAVLLSRLSPAGTRLFAFEPDPLNFSLLSENIRINRASNVQIEQLALAEEPGTMPLYQHSSSNLGRHSLIPTADGTKVAVQVTTLDDFWARNELGEHPLKFLKIDIEGYELQALRGGVEVLRRCQAVFCEFAPEYMQRGNIDPGDLVDFLVGLDFKPHLIGAAGLEPVDTDWLRSQPQIVDLLWEKQAV